MIGNARGSHSSPGIYMKEVDLSYAAKSLGITTLGVVGETLKGPAFEPIRIENWGEFVNYFGGTSTETFLGTGYPKYELPYIAKSYLKNSNQLEVCRVLGLSGYNAGPAWVITASKGVVEGYVEHKGSLTDANGSEIVTEIPKEKKGEYVIFDNKPYKWGLISQQGPEYVVAVLRSRATYYDVTKPSNACEGDANYDVLNFNVDNNVNITLNNYTSVSTIINKCPSQTEDGNETTFNTLSPGEYGKFTIKVGNNEYSVSMNPMDKDYIINVLGTNQFDGSSDIFVESLFDVAFMDMVDKGELTVFNTEVKCITDKVEMDGDVDNGYKISNYKSEYRCASSPWVVSELKGDKTNIKLERLFRFHTISDGNCANNEVKVSIQNIKPDEGLFDVIVRKFDDVDSNPVILERFNKCSMVEGTSNFIGLKIGTFDGEYVVKSKYITVEVNVNESTESCVPAGFLGYPMPNFGNDLKLLDMGYNDLYDDDIDAKKQYFGFSSIKGIDVDLFTYKGVDAYKKGVMSKGFHLDSRIGEITNLYIDGKIQNNAFQYVDPNNSLKATGTSTKPLIGRESEMVGSIYENMNLRKFTVCLYGGFDGWDIYRKQRTNTDEFKVNKYRGVISKTSTFSEISDPQSLHLNGKCMTSDYYAYLAGARQFDNIEAVDINLFATPGIDYINQTMLSKEILAMIEDERGDALYVMTTPDKTSNGDMVYPDEAVVNLEDVEIDSNYAATYYPWVKYFDKDNSKYINLPASKDALAAMAYTDNVSYPWFAPAGTVRGNVECERAAFITKLEDEDTLYEGRINPIKTFAVDGVKIWGQKTMYDNDTPLNRINVRRLMLRVKKLISGACRRLIFEQNDATVKGQFEGLVRPILDDIKAKRGIYDYRLTVDDSPEARDRQELPASIMIKPTKALEYIDITFTIMPESVSFDE